MSDAPVIVAVEGGVATLTLDRPDAGNAIDLPTAHALITAAIRCQTDRAIRAVVLTGAGRLFCAGGDVRLMSSAGAQAPALLAELAGAFHLAVTRLLRMPKPLVTLVNGPAAGAGFSLALLGDIVLAARSAHFTAAYGAIGLTPDGGLSWTLPRLVGLRRAQQIILANPRIGAEEAAALGLVTRVVDDEALVEEGRRLARRLADGPAAALGATRTLLWESSETSFETHLDRELRTLAAAGASADAREGLDAFLARRPANFKGE